VESLRVPRVQPQGLAVRLDRRLLVADLLLLDGGQSILELGALLGGGEEVAGPREGGGEITPQVLVAVELRQLAEGLHVRLELERADESVGRLVGVLQPLEVDAGDLPEDGLARLDRRRRLDLVLQRDDELAVPSAAPEHLGHRVERRGVGGMNSDLPERGLGLGGRPGSVRLRARTR
jgi:hypothetical protein